MGFLDKAGLQHFKDKLDTQIENTITTLDNNKLDKPSGVQAGKFLQTDSHGDAVWGNSASPTEIANAVTDWLDDNVPTGQTVAIDRSLLVDGAAADSKTTGDAIDALVQVKATQPEETRNKIWIKDSVTEYTVPTQEEFDNLNRAIDNISGGGINVLPVDDISQTLGGLTVTYKDGVLTRNGTSTASVSFKAGKITKFILKAGTYTFWSDTPSFNVLYVLDMTENIISHVNDAQTGTFTLSQDTEVWLTIEITANRTYDNVITNVQLESGTVTTVWQEPYLTAVDSFARNSIINIGKIISGESVVLDSSIVATMYNGSSILQPQRSDMNYYKINRPSNVLNIVVEYETADSNGNHWYNEFDSSNNLLYATTLAFSITETRNIIFIHNPNTSYIKLSTWTVNGDTIFSYTLNSITASEFTLVSALGDSITNGYNPNGYVTDTYQKLIADKLNAGFQKLGVNSTPICPNSDYTDGQNNNAFVYRYTQISANADLIIVAGGTNDFRHNVPLGTPNDDASDFETTFYGAVDYLITNIVTSYVGAKLVFITPFHQINDTVANNAGFKLTDYINAIKDKCSQYGITCIDGYSYSGVSLIPAFVTNFMSDSLHPNGDGHKLIYKNLMPFFAML